MSANPIPPPSDDPSLRPVQDPVAEIRAICARHSLPCGSPDSLAEFMRAVQNDKHLAMDFWSLVARLTDAQSSHSANPDWLLATVVEGVTGQNLADAQAADPAERLLVNKLGSLLAGEDLQTPPPSRPAQSVRPSISIGHRKHHRLVLKPESPFADAMDRSTREQQPKPGHGEPDHTAQEPEQPIVIPLAAYAEEEPDGSVARKLIGGIVLLLIIVGALLYHNNWSRLTTSIRTQYTAVVARKDHSAPQAAAPNNGAQSGVTTNPITTPTEPQPTAAPEPTTAPESPNPPQAVVPPKARPAAPSSDSPAIDTPHTAAQVEVPASEMKQNLISSRVPIFPEGTSGPVVVQAIVTASGTVEPVRVVRGNPELARAAMAAVATWRYRPYLLNGVPVSVSTTISVDTSGND